MSLLKVFILAVLLAALAVVVLVRVRPDAVPVQYLERVTQLPQQVREMAQRRNERSLSTSDAPAAAGAGQTAAPSAPQHATTPTAQSTPPAPPRASPNAVTLYLTNGGMVTGELVAQTAQDVTLRWDYGEVSFVRAEIARMVGGRQVEGEEDIVLPAAVTEARKWKHAHDAVFRLLNGSVVDAELRAVTETELHLVQTLEGGGTVELTIPRAQLDQVVFRPVENERSETIRQSLQEIFPTMARYEEGLFTIVTDSPTPSVKGYRRAIRELATDAYLTFHELFAGRAPTVQQYIVIFDEFGDYIEYAVTDGVPGWLAPGYFDPESEVLYTVNILGDRFSELLYEIYLGQFRNARDQFLSDAGIKGSRYEDFIEGQISEFLQKLESAHSQLRGLYGQLSELILRHELTHAIFHNWRLQTIILSKLREEDVERAKQKRAFLDEQDPAKKRQLLEAMLTQESDVQLPETQADNSWIVEGIAEHLGPSPLGSLNTLRLEDIQEALRTQQLLPLEFLNVFRIGSFPGITHQARLFAYAQSWAYVRFLMERYRQPFVRYLDRLARERPQPGDDTLSWLLKGIGKDVRALDAEFQAYAASFPPEKPFWFQQLQININLRDELEHLYHRL